MTAVLLRHANLPSLTMYFTSSSRIYPAAALVHTLLVVTPLHRPCMAFRWQVCVPLIHHSKGVFCGVDNACVPANFAACRRADCLALGSKGGPHSCPASHGRCDPQPSCTAPKAALALWQHSRRGYNTACSRGRYKMPHAAAFGMHKGAGWCSSGTDELWGQPLCHGGQNLSQVVW
jgi:hypothetical protein